MTPAEIVNHFTGLLKGEDIKVGDYIIRHPSGGELDFTINQIGGDLHLTFMGKKPVASWFVFNGAINGLIICVKGVKVDIAQLPGRADPFIPWEKMGL